MHRGTVSSSYVRSRQSRQAAHHNVWHTCIAAAAKEEWYSLSGGNTNHSCMLTDALKASPRDSVQTRFTGSPPIPTAWSSSCHPNAPSSSDVKPK